MIWQQTTERSWQAQSLGLCLRNNNAMYLYKLHQSGVAQQYQHVSGLSWCGICRKWTFAFAESASGWKGGNAYTFTPHHRSLIRHLFSPTSILIGSNCFRSKKNKTRPYLYIMRTNMLTSSIVWLIFHSVLSDKHPNHPKMWENTQQQTKKHQTYVSQSV